jgi:tetratricopeptide (TPR) repeat protein
MVDNYYQGRLSEKEMQDIEKRALTDKELLDLMTIYKESDFAIRNKELLDFIKESKKAGKDYFKKSKVRKIYLSTKTGVTIAASFLILMGLIYFLIMSFNRKNPEKLFTEYFKPYNKQVLRSNNGEPDNFHIGCIKYTEKNYTDAIEHFRIHLKKFPDNNITRIYLANAFLAKEQIDESLALLNEIQNSNDMELYNASNWYTALIYLKTNKLQKSKLYLHNIISSKNEMYKAESEKLLEDIENITGELR